MTKFRITFKAGTNNLYFREIASLNTSIKDVCEFDISFSIFVNFVLLLDSYKPG